MDWVLFWTIIGVGVSLVAVASSLGAAFWRRITLSERKAEIVEGRIEQKVDAIEHRLETKLDAFRAEIGTWIQMLTVSNQDLTARVARLEGRIKNIH